MTKKENVTEVEEMLKNIETINHEVYLSSLCIFKALVFSCFTHDDTATCETAIKFAEIVIERDSTAAIGHYILGKNLRRIRRLVSVFKNPEESELFHLKKAYELDKNPKFGLFCALCLKENRNPNAIKIFERIYRKNLKGKTSNLRLALAFIQGNKLVKAKKCFDYVESIEPEKSTFLHYKELYLMKRK